jgi:hypothetical protein
MKNIYTLIAGFGIGILMGLSKSPILVQILVPVLTLFVSLISVLSGQSGQTKSEEVGTTILGLKNVNILPIMAMIVGLVFGAFIGLICRNYDITNPSAWSKKTKFDLSIDSLNMDIKLLSLNQQKIVLEKQNKYLVLQEIKANTESSLTFSELTSIKKISEDQNNKINIPDKRESKESQSVLFGEKGMSIEQACKLIPKICDLSPAELVAACLRIDDYDIKTILRSSKIDTDSLKFKISETCNCNH